jgi:hypothetical protein
MPHQQMKHVWLLTIASWGLLLAMRIGHAADFVVTNTNDNFSLQFGNPAAGSLRSAILQANAAGAGSHTITFAPNVQGTILLKDFLHIENNITIRGPGIDQLSISGDVARADFDGNEFSAYIESGSSWPGSWGTIQPFFGAQYVLIHRNAATETGAAPFNLSLASSTDDSSRGFLGARIIGVNSWREKIVSGVLHARWMHEFLSDARIVNARIAALPTAPGFTAVGNSLGMEFGSVGAT